MKTSHLLLIAGGVYLAYRYQNSHHGQSAVDRVVARESGVIAGLNGTNFTNSYWDAASGQPGYMFGPLLVPGGTAVMKPADWNTGAVFGHM
jgi:hypothetical protein